MNDALNGKPCRVGASAGCSNEEIAPDGSGSNKLAEENLPMVSSVAKRFLGRGAELRELCQAGTVGLLRAAESYDPMRNVPFPAYAFRFIEGEIRAFLRSQNAIRLDRAARETAARARRLAALIESKNGGQCKLRELASEMQMDAAELGALFNASMGCISLDDCGGGRDAADFLSDPSAGAEVDRALDGAYLNSLMAVLSEKERSVIRLRYIFDMTQAMTAERLGISQAQVSRYERSALGKLRRVV